MAFITDRPVTRATLGRDGDDEALDLPRGESCQNGQPGQLRPALNFGDVAARTSTVSNGILD